MMISWQTAIVGIVLLSALLYIAQQFWVKARSFSSNSSKSGCGGDCGCDSGAPNGKNIGVSKR